MDNLLDARKRGDFIAKEDCIFLDYVDNTSKHSLVTLATLFGLGAGTDLKGKPISKVVAELSKVQLQNPQLDLTKLEDINKLQAYAEQVDLFNASYPDETSCISDNKWRKTGENVYVLSIINRETVTVIKDVLDNWRIIGDCNGYSVRDAKRSLEEAIKEADFKVGLLGGRRIKALVSRSAKWCSNAPTEMQLLACKRLRIVVPPGATKSEV